MNLELPAQDVDVNVHPTKKEVRYKNPNQIFNFVRTSVEAGLSNYVEKEYHPIPPQQNNIVDFQPVSRNDLRIDNENDTMYVSDSLMQKIQEEIASPKEIKQQTIIQTAIQETEPEENIIGQYKNTYILIEKDEGLEIVDQHIAEERFIYEKLKSEKQIASQMLFISDVVSVSSTDISSLSGYGRARNSI